MKKNLDRPWFYRAVALVLAILLAIYINWNQQGFFPQGKKSVTMTTATTTETIKVPLQVSVDTDKYYVTGYPDKVSVTLKGANALVTSIINTRNFRAFIDLSNLKPGSHQVKIQLNGMSSQVKATLQPKLVKVNIQKRKSQTFPVQIEYNKSAIAKNYMVGTPKSSPRLVRVTGAQGEVNQIDHIRAKAVLTKGQATTYSREVILTAVDSKNRQLNVVIDPLTANISIPIYLPHKSVKIKLKTSNEDRNKKYSINADKNTVTLYGTKNSLKTVKELPVDVNLKSITSNTEKTIPLVLPKGIKESDPKEIKVNIEVLQSSHKKSD
ncbi:hypothetical protein FP435_02345 [Lactobacillus sp. PV037]|uniref:CdaR family protein n=1 Tax=Lactobacillus sp. PV037 TaxID=2594496 RepID=UPI00223F01E1|nr:CdaR family protein [Lactobacillus sp. PV037]QNQ83355.1 hypothetical protein FP435_02345 [Lactobacillus sp. PV037]